MKPTVLIIGGGVSGSVCALSLRRQGIEVDLAEKSIFPFQSVVAALGERGYPCFGVFK